jgi:hypothetical protein
MSDIAGLIDLARIVHEAPIQTEGSTARLRPPDFKKDRFVHEPD